MQLVGADRGGEICNQNFDRVAVTLREEFGLDKDTANHLRGNYGTRALQLALLARDEPQFTTKTKDKMFYKRLHPKYPQLEAEVAFACRCVRTQGDGVRAQRAGEGGWDGARGRPTTRLR
jgi:glycerol-3-phosphate dehydrogenase